MTKNYLYVVIVLALSFFLGGCSSVKTIESEQSTNALQTNGVNKKLAIVGNYIVDQEITANPGLVSLTAKYGVSMLSEIKMSLASNFSVIDIVGKDFDAAKYDYILIPKNNIRGVCGADTCTFYSETPYLFRSTSTGQKNIEARIDDTFFWSIPTKVKPLAIITGLTLMIIAPVTMPLMVDWEGEELARVVLESNKNTARKISASITSNAGVQ